MRETVHSLKLQDAIHRQEIRKLERANKALQSQDSGQLAAKLAELEKQKAVDEQYLLKQQELIVRLELASELGEKRSESDRLKEKLKSQRASNKANTDWLVEYRA
jgi:hypothetical protein